MDYDDQMIYAFAVLRKHPAVLEHFQDLFRYICVDEAQDTSKIAKKHSGPSRTKQTTSSSFSRSPYIAQYAKRRANGFCQLCDNPAPFVAANGEPYLESHHVIWLSQGGQDSIENTVALCPNCHRKMHIINDQADVAKLKRICG